MKTKTKTKTTRIIRNILLVLLAVLFLIVSGTYIFNKIKTAQEIELLKANGYYNPVSVGDYSLNVAIFGNGGTIGSELKDGIFSVIVRFHV